MAQRHAVKVIGRAYRTLRWLTVWSAAAACGVWAPRSGAQAIFAGSVYVDDSPAAQDGVARAVELAGVGNLDESCRVLQRLLDDNGDQLVQVAGDADLYVSVRERVMSVLAGDEKLLARYRQSEQPAAAALLRTGQVEACERSRLLTQAGFESALILAQRRFDNAGFFGAWRTLRQLDHHPDFAGENAAKAVGLLAQTVAYLAGDARHGPEELKEAKRLLSDWRDRAGGTAPGEQAVALPGEEFGRGPLEPGPKVELASVLPRPLASEFIGMTLEEVQTMAARSGLGVAGTGAKGLPITAAVLQSVPTIAGDTVYINDSETVSAWDRFTLAKRWRVRIEPPALAGVTAPATGQGLEDCNWVAVRGHRLATVGGLASGVTNRQGVERTISVLDTRDGRVLWSTTLSQAASENQAVLAECFPRGPALIEEGLVIVSAARYSVDKRLQGAYLVAFDLETGRVRWTRNLGSMGVVPWSASGFPADITASRAGVLYRTDRVGTIVAVEAVNGRALWVRRVPPDPVAQNTGRGTRPQPWDGGEPIIDGERLITLSPDKLRLVVLEARTGRVLERVPATILANPDYLLSAPATKPGGPIRLIAIDSGQISLMQPAGLLAESSYEKLAGLLPPGIRGRVSLAGESLVVPLIEGVLLVPLKPASGDAASASTLVRLDNPGQVLALESQLLVVDDQRVHSYLLWETANGLLQKRMSASPQDPAPAVTFAELSFRAGKHENLIPAIDKAVRAIEADPTAAPAGVARGRLFLSILDMVEPDAQAATITRLSDDIRRQLIDRLLQLAAAPGEQVQALMAAGEFAAGANKAAEAVEHYQSILLSASLASQNYTHGGATSPADVEAARRLRRLVREAGRGAYSAYDAEAQEKLAQLLALPGGTNAGADEGALERLARSYPVSSAAPRAWLEQARRHHAAGRELPALGALEEGLSAAESALEPGDPLLGEIGGQLVTEIAAGDRPSAALRMLDQVERKLGNVALTLAGKPVDGAALRSSLRSRLAQSEKRPRVGAPNGKSSVLNGWGVVPPICGEAPGAPTDRVVLGALNGEIAVWKAGVSATGAPVLSKLWGDGAAEAFLRIDAKSVLTARRNLQGGNRYDQTVTRRDIDTGKPLWEIASFRALFSDRSRRPFPAADERIETPLRHQVPAGEVVVLIDERTMVLVDRVGRAAAFDYESGKLLWAMELEVERVFDAVISDGAVAFAGAPGAQWRAEPAQGGEEESKRQGVVQVVSARTGQTIMSQGERTQVNWLCFGEDGGLALGLGSGVVMYDPYRGELRWRNESPLAHDTAVAWALTGRVVVRNSDGKFLSLSAESGELDARALDTRDKADQLFVEADFRQFHDRALLLTTHGLAAYDGGNKLLFADALGSEVLLRMPRLGMDAALLVESGAREGPAVDGGPSLYPVHVVSTVSGKLIGTASVELPTSPTEAALLDGMIVVSSGTACVLIGAPASP